MRVLAFDIIKGLLALGHNAAKDEYITSCTFCGKKDHFYINRDTLQWDCKKCGEHGGQFKLLKKLGKLNLIFEGRELSFGKLENRLQLSIDESISDTIKPISRPLGFTRIDYHWYLQNRGIEPIFYEKYEFGVTDVVGKLKDRIIVLIKENELVYGYLGRTVKDKKWIEQYELQNNKKYLRYIK